MQPHDKSQSGQNIRFFKDKVTPALVVLLKMSSNKSDLITVSSRKLTFSASNSEKTQAAKDKPHALKTTYKMVVGKNVSKDSDS